MSSVTSSWRERRQAARNRRALDRAVARAHTPEMQHELLTLASGGGLRPHPLSRPAAVHGGRHQSDPGLLRRPGSHCCPGPDGRTGRCRSPRGVDRPSGRAARVPMVFSCTAKGSRLSFGRSPCGGRRAAATPHTAAAARDDRDAGPRPPRDLRGDHHACCSPTCASTGGEEAVDEVLRRADVPDSAEELLHVLALEQLRDPDPAVRRRHRGARRSARRCSASAPRRWPAA